ncbi:MAG TPA: class I SAM-dependent methyltransferase [Candidatus Doudnabacteria bacterium]|nr:class I SAM-dependent methyltransferase [Candidatus Doudnabacteria bacterium]
MSTDKKTIKSYDGYADKWAAHMRSGENISHTFLEKPAMYRKLPNLKGKTILCIGCGTGEECAYLKSLGAKRVVGIDISKGLIKVAKKSYPDIEFYVMDMEKLKFSINSFDFIYSSLVMHYVRDWTKPLKSMQKVMKKNGTLLFSTHHPVRWGAKSEIVNNQKSTLLGYYKDRITEKSVVVGDYLNSRKINDVWFGDFKVTYYHKPLSEIFSEIIKSGFEILDFIEPKPEVAVKKKKKIFWDTHSKIPLFMLFELKKK